ncbi:hypothetical protein COCMIDRAFT_29267 [Bipolaris oryzae ATCC 44560]|uniref:Eukaryotic translation initiation factor 1A n=1 Tax=Bipolaris oryzae ATCC 44560 TaxID=930090 RepID=W6YWZ0_COCMI|nr:uncharacterized protein COCMIDRAFT_29267 [Bipolaris oryzae ATCC 44560]EUC42038.1 hypothetical protein COCMIDRAFT_29267 [Bipolaris oryzae ATCC 44560]
MPKNKGKAAPHLAPWRSAKRQHHFLNFPPRPSNSANPHANHIPQQGGKNRRRGKNENDNEKRELVFKEEGQEYAQVVKMLGNGRLEAQCFDGARRLAHIRGKLRKKVWINQGDIILLSLRDYQDEKGDVIMKYSADEARSLKAYGELPENAKINETDTYGDQGDEGIGFEFDEDRDDSDSDEAEGGGKKEIDIDDI